MKKVMKIEIVVVLFGDGGVEGGFLDVDWLPEVVVVGEDFPEKVEL
jgi:hypothetical protein